MFIIITMRAHTSKMCVTPNLFMDPRSNLEKSRENAYIILGSCLHMCMEVDVDSMNN